MIAINKTTYRNCERLLASFFEKFPNPQLQTEVNHIVASMLQFKVSMAGKLGGWAGGIIYASANQYHQACGIPGILNKECEEFFGVSMGTIYKRAAMINKLMWQN